MYLQHKTAFLLILFSDEILPNINNLQYYCIIISNVFNYQYIANIYMQHTMKSNTFFY